MFKAVAPNIPNLIVMIRPQNFGFNSETAQSNSFQKNIKVENVAAKALFEFDSMVAELRRNGIQVKIFDDQDQVLPDSVFSNNWISHIPDGPLVTYSMNAPNRRAEVRDDVIDWCKTELGIKEIYTLTSEVDKQRFLEGTGSIVFDHDNKVAYSCISPRTNLGLLTKLVDHLGYSSVSFESKDLRGNQIYHTNVMMNIGKKTVMICLASIQSGVERMMLRESLEKTGKEIVELTYPQIDSFAGNAMEVNNERGETFVIMSETAGNSLGLDQLIQIKNRSKILFISIPTIETIGGGSVRCMMTGLFNYSK